MSMPCPFEAKTVTMPFHHRGERVPRMHLSVLLPIGWRAQLYEMARGLEAGGQLWISCFSGISHAELDAHCAAYGLKREGNLFTRVDVGVL